MKPDTARRNFVKIGSLAIAAAATGSLAGRAGAQGKEPHLEENDQQAQALGYKHDAAKVDRKKYANYQPGQDCANCQQFKGKPKDAWGPCQIFPGKQVNAKGWCSAWMKKG